VTVHDDNYRTAKVFGLVLIGVVAGWTLFAPEDWQLHDRGGNHSGIRPIDYFGFKDRNEAAGSGPAGLGNASVDRHGRRQWHRECHADVWGRVTCEPIQDGELPPRRTR
jgi:hypothetical protein